jgi:uncharacterized membrane-anchored protein
MPWYRRPLVLALAVALVQTAALAAMILDRARLVAGGREIVLPVIPVDPRSLFRGDYVILTYDISRVPAPPGAEPGRQYPDPLFITLARRTEKGRETWAATAASQTFPQRVAGDEIVLAGRQVGRVYQGSGRLETRVRYGIESYFVPEGAGRDLEQRVREGTMAVVAAVDSRGRTAIKGLVLDGQVRYDEPLF